MKLKVLLPNQVLVDEEAAKVVAEAENGSFCLLPRHVDFVAALAPGILSFVDPRGVEVFLALDEGVLVKQGAEVLVSTRRGVRGGQLGELRRLVSRQFRELDQQEVKARSAMAKIEAGFVRRFLELQELG
ncbi:MAG: F0F1 ATP synthase subunit epsilon [Desulfarculaceae bacterium]|nr:F0F1 ATP synthase subunit epsilon [Desulfarculaceae bacterium]MCF8073167.1 F0F1 ATP synthase subunit epsilon [Desulfarculaceae bacterium]MCF8100763.1 F0F1 ATP synthase subunit epsilon [Desulfarculaceae bacterium]MCF8118410.1 F0F1 ATP synthase subunit epsilon [Desulfarculaceae bacterium]